MPVENRQFWVTVYKSENEFWQAGKPMQINCFHVNLGNMGMTTTGEIIPAPGSLNASPITSPAGNPVVKVDQATPFASPTAFGDAEFKAVTLIKDMVNQVTYYVDTAGYTTAIGTMCNPANVN